MAVEHDPRLAEAIENRMKDLEIWGPAELERRSGISPKTVRGILEGVVLKRADVKNKLTSALGWTPDSLDRIRAGEPPVAVQRVRAVAHFRPKLPGLTDEENRLINMFRVLEEPEQGELLTAAAAIVRSAMDDATAQGEDQAVEDELERRRGHTPAGRAAMESNPEAEAVKRAREDLDEIHLDPPHPED